MKERELIGWLRRQQRARSSNLRVGIGDDCAVLSLAPDEELLVTTDLCLEGVHFLREWQLASHIGHWCITRGLSDIAAMGGRPVAAFLSLACPRDTEEAWVHEFLTGFEQTAASYGIPLAGGDTAMQPTGIVADVLVLGAAPKGEAVLRSGAKPGDTIYVTGALGGPQAELRRLQAGEAEERCYRPVALIASGQFLRTKVSAMIDISDGLSTDLAHLCEASGVSAEISATCIPIAKGAALDDALHGGDEYQLLFTAPPEARLPLRYKGVTWKPIGTIREKKAHAVFLRSGTGRPRPLPNRGWQHTI